MEAFCRAVRTTLLDPAADSGKRYLRWLVDEILVKGKTAVMRGSYAALACAVRTDGEVHRARAHIRTRVAPRAGLMLSPQ